MEQKEYQEEWDTRKKRNHKNPQAFERRRSSILERLGTLKKKVNIRSKGFGTLERAIKRINRSTPEETLEKIEAELSLFENNS